MIIVSQDRETIVNFDNTKYINIEGREIFANTRDYMYLGEYETNKRAKELLEEMADSIQGQVRVFYMPEE